MTILTYKGVPTYYDDTNLLGSACRREAGRYYHLLLATHHLLTMTILTYEYDDTYKGVPTYYDDAYLLWSACRREARGVGTHERHAEQ